MGSLVACPKCGETSAEGATFCFQCGTALRGAAAAPIPSAGRPAPPPLTQAESAYLYGRAAPEVSYERRRDVDRTRTGVLLLLVGGLVSWIPVIGVLGGLVTLVGAILVILGRGAFGPAHARDVSIAIILFIIGIVGGFILAVNFVAQIYSDVSLPTGQAGPAITSAFDGLLLGAIVLGLISGLASVFFLYELLNLEGRVLIWASYLVGIGISFLVYALITPQVNTAIASAFSGTAPDITPLLALDNQINSLRLLSAIPSLLSAGAAYVAWSRITRGEIPQHRGPTQPLR